MKNGRGRNHVGAGRSGYGVWLVLPLLVVGGVAARCRKEKLYLQSPILPIFCPTSPTKADLTV